MYFERTKKNLKIQDSKGLIIDSVVEYYSFDWADWTLDFNSPITGKNSFTGVDLFECLTKLRLELETHDYKILCAGSRIDVYPSSMCRNMGDGLVAQVMTPNTSENIDDVEHVGIFDDAEPELIASVEEQFNYYAARFSVSYKFRIQHQDGHIVEGVIHENRVKEPNKIEFESPVTPNIQVRGSNAFECLNNFQNELEKYEYHPVCNGARFDTYILLPDLADDGIWIHVLTPGKLPAPEDKVETFGDTEARLITSISEQRNNYYSWLESIKFIPISDYDDCAIYYLPELYFRLTRIGDLPLMWLFDLDPSSQLDFDDDINNFIKKNNDEDRIRALSPLSPEQVEKIGTLKGEAILGFITGEQLSLEYFRPNRVFIDFLQNVISIEAPKDPELQAAASEQKEGYIYIIDRRVADNPQEETSSQDILGAFEIKDGQIVSNSYQRNQNYLIFGKNGLFQLPDSLYQSLINSLEAL